MKHSILLVEDDPVWREMLLHFINNEPDMQIVHCVQSKTDAIDYCTHHKVDVVLMDMSLSNHHMEGIEATIELSMMELDVKVVALTSHTDERIILDAYTAGVVQYVLKSNFRKIPDIVREVRSTISPQEVLANAFVRLKTDEQYHKLTPTEKELIELYADGKNRAAIQEKLSKSDSTIRNQTTGILKKFNASSIKQVIRIIKSRGLKP